MSEKSTLLSEDELKEYLARWTMNNSRFAPRSKSSDEAAFIFDYVIPDTRFEVLSHYISGNDDIISVFKTEIILSDWQSRDQRRHRIAYLKFMTTEIDSLGNLFSYISGYSIVNEN